MKHKTSGKEYNANWVIVHDRYRGSHYFAVCKVVWIGKYGSVPFGYRAGYIMFRVFKRLIPYSQQ